ncbi:MAG: DmsE family decaheme c-type cytochrome [Acidobacteriota bacterium]
MTAALVSQKVELNPGLKEAGGMNQQFQTQHKGERTATRFAWMIVALALAIFGYSPATMAQAHAAAASPATTTASGFVGSETCETCHADVVKGFGDNPHSKLALAHNGKGVTCESCHGPGQAHVESGGDVTKIKQLSKMSAKMIDETCLTCHAKSHPNFLRSPHAKAGVSCLSCHSVHKPGEEANLLKVAQPKLCFTCHNDVQPQFSMPFHHKVNEGLIKCSDCHDTHGTFQANQVKTTADKNAVCTKCHTETRGPFVFEHAAVRAEGCQGCHTPHGSQNARLLNVPNVNQLCNQCHSQVATDNVHNMGAGSNDLQACIGCHTMIHGSNANVAFIR